MNPRSIAVFRSYAVAVAACASLLVSCGGSDDDNNTVQSPAVAVVVPYTNGVAPTSNVVAYWNLIASDTINAPASASGTPEEQRPILQVDLATVHVAIYDAVNAIAGTHKVFIAAPTISATGASQEAATAAAAVGVLKGLFPSRSALYQAAYDAFIAALPAGDATTRGIAVGTEVAAGVLASRANDGRSTAVSYTPGTAPGNFRGMNPIGNFNRFVKPFALTSLAQFRTPAPPALDSAAYAADFNETKAFGATTSSVRTATQEEAARFHTEAPPRFISRNLRAFAMADRSVAYNARLMAAIWVAQADGGNACFESKYFYERWRPTSAITLADTDGNADTTVDATWTPVVATPNHPEYPAAHACTAGALAAVLREFFGTNQISYSFSSTVTSSVHAFNTPDDMVTEMQAARIYGGMHFRTSNVQGGVLTTKVGEWVARNYFRPRD